MNNSICDFGAAKIYIGDKELETISSIDFADGNDETSIDLYNGGTLKLFGGSYSFASTIKMSKKNKNRFLTYLGLKKYRLPRKLKKKREKESNK